MIKDETIERLKSLLSYLSDERFETVLNVIYAEIERIQMLLERSSEDDDVNRGKIKTLRWLVSLKDAVYQELLSRESLDI